MTFFTAISGLNAASKNLAVTGNNIANANTTGFKQSRAEFADVYASSVGGVSKTQPGTGVRVTNVAQQFSQGNINATGNNLDLAISGEGFFSLGTDATSDQPSIYTRSGEFKLDKDGYVVNNQGNFLMAFKPNGTTVADGFSSGVFQPLRVNAEQGSPVASSALAVSANLQSTQTTPVSSPVDPTNPDSYNHGLRLSVPAARCCLNKRPAPARAPERPAGTGPAAVFDDYSNARAFYCSIDQKMPGCRFSESPVSLLLLNVRSIA